ncbi:MAG: PAS domain S-box protein, partial [Chloroflexi bacterium]|nr:PAS domain S-box protein [Chloroflexota bacterium]
MNLETLLGLVNNTALLLALAVLYETIPLFKTRRSRLLEIFTGLLVGSIGMAVMLTPWRFSEGIIFDTRSILLSMTGLFFGAIPTTLATLMTCALRLYQGGDGAVMGVSVILTSAGLGLLWRYFLRVKKQTPSWYQFYGFGIVVHLNMLLWTFALPREITIDVLRKISLPVMLIYPVGTVLLGLILQRRSQRLEGQQTIREERDLFALISETSPVGIVMVDRSGQIEFANAQAEKILGLSRNMITQRSYNAPEWKVTDSDGEPFPEEQLPFRQVMDTLKPVQNVIHAIQWPNGRRVLLSINAAPLFDQAGKVNGMISAVEDITAIKRAEDEIRAHVAFLDNIMEQSPFAMWISDITGTIIKTNKALREKLNLSDEQLLGKYNVLTDENLRQQGVMPQVKAVFEHQERARFIIPWAGSKTGDSSYESASSLWMDVSMFPIINKAGHIANVVCQWIDITEQVQAETALRALSTRQGAILAAVPDIIMEVDNNKIYTWANQAGLEFFGEDVIGKSADFYFEGEQDTYSVVQPLFNGAENVIYIESWQRRKDGKKRLLAWWCRTLKDENGNVTGALSSARDITENRNIEQALRDSDALYHDLVETAQDLIWQCDAEGRYTYLNPAWEAVFGYTVAEMLGKRFSDFQTPEMAARDLDKFDRLLQGDSVKGHESIHIGKAGNEIHLVFNAKFLADKDGHIIGTRGTAYDVTDRVRATQALSNSEAKMRSVFTVAPVGIGVVINRILQDVNERFCEISGYSRAELIGQNARIVYISDEDYEYIGQEKYRQIQKRGTGTVQTQFRRKDGEIVDVLLSSTPINPDDLSIGVTFTALDITDRVQAENEIKRRVNSLAALVHIGNLLASTLDLQKLFQATTDGVVDLIGLDSSAIYLREEETLYLWATSPALSPDFPDMYRKALLKDHPHIQRCLTIEEPIFMADSQQAQLTEAERQVSEGRGLRTILYLPIITGEETKGVLIVGSVGETCQIQQSDIDLCMTLANQASLAIANGQFHQQMQEYASQLEQRVAERTSQLESFAYSVSHDLKAPLRGIHGYSNLLLKNYADQLDDDGKFFLNNVHIAAENMRQLIDDLLECSRVERREMIMQQINLAHIVQVL